MQVPQFQPPQPGPSNTDQAYQLLTRIRKYRWLGLEGEAEKLMAELARLQSGATPIEPPETD